MKTKDKKLPDDIEAIVNAKIARTTSWENSKLSKEREKVTRYYNSEYPKRRSEGSSSFISNDVYDAVEGMKAQLLDTFANGFDIVRFDPQDAPDCAAAAIATSYTSYVMFRQNDGYDILSQVIHDGLTARVGIVGAFWEERYEYVDEEFDNLTRDEVNGLVAMDHVESLEANADPAPTASQDPNAPAPPQLFSGTLCKKVDKSQVRIELFNPEEFFIDPSAKRLSKRYTCGTRSIKTFDELEDMGIDVKKLKGYNYGDDQNLQNLPEVLARFQQLNSVADLDNTGEQDAVKRVLVYDIYLMLKLKGDQRAKLYHVIQAGGHTLDYEAVDDLPFLAFTPLPIPHSFFGNNFANRVIPTQNVRTSLTRAVIDHTAITVNPRWQVVQGGLTNPRELLDNRLGGIVNVRRPDSVSALQQANLNPFVFQTLEMVKASNEETTGISSLSQGLNKDAISSQNSQGMVKDLVNLSQTRQAVIARNFANNFLIPLYLKIYDLVIQHENKQNVVELAGQWVPINPKLWKERKAASVSLHLGYGAQSREAEERMAFGAAMMHSPETDRMFTGKYKFLVDVMKLKGIQNTADYLTDPATMPPPSPPQPTPLEQAEMQVKQTEAQAKLMTAQSAMAKVQEHSKLDTMKTAVKASQVKTDIHLKTVEENRKVAETHNKIDVAQREMVLLENATPAETKAIVAPH